MKFEHCNNISVPVFWLARCRRIIRAKLRWDFWHFNFWICAKASGRCHWASDMTPASLPLNTSVWARTMEESLQGRDQGWRCKQLCRNTRITFYSATKHDRSFISCLYTFVKWKQEVHFSYALGHEHIKMNASNFSFRKLGIILVSVTIFKLCRL